MLKRYFGSGFTKNVLTLVTASVLAQAINFGFSIFLTRIYSPSDFGSISVFLSLVSFAMVVSLGKYDIALVTADDKNDALDLVSIGSVIAVCITLVLLALVCIIYVIPVPFYNGSPVRGWLYLIPVSMLLLSIFQLLWMWNTRTKQFKAIASLRPIEALVNNSVSLVLKVYKATGLLIGAIAGQLLSAVLITIITLRRENKILKNVQLNNLKKVAEKYVEFPKVNIIQGFVDMFQVNVLIIILSASYDPQYIGYYTLCARVLQVPVRLLIAPVSNVFFSEASELNNQGENLFKLVKVTMFKTGFIILPFFIIILLAGPFLFQLAFGKQWYESGVYARIFTLWYFLDMVKAPVTQIAFVKAKQRQFLYLSLIGIVLLVVASLMGIFVFKSLMATLTLVAISQVIAALLIIVFIVKWVL